MTHDTDAKNIQKLNAEIKKLRKQLLDKDANRGFMTRKDNLTTPKETDKSRTEEHEKEFKKQLEQKDHALAQKDKIIEELRHKLEKQNTNTQDKDDYNKLKEQYAELEAKYRAVVGGKDQREKNASPLKDAYDGKRPESRQSEGKSSEPRRDRVQSAHGGAENRNKLKRVTLDDVKDFGYELSLKLRINEIAVEDILVRLDPKNLIF